MDTDSDVRAVYCRLFGVPNTPAQAVEIESFVRHFCGLNPDEETMGALVEALLSCWVTQIERYLDVILSLLARSPLVIGELTRRRALRLLLALSQMPEGTSFGTDTDALHRAVLRQVKVEAALEALGTKRSQPDPAAPEAADDGREVSP